MKQASPYHKGHKTILSRKFRHSWGQFIFIVFTFLFSSCGGGANGGEVKNDKFDFRVQNMGDFFVFNKGNKLSSIHYIFNGAINNKTEQIFEAIDVEMHVRYFYFFDSRNELQLQSNAENIIFGENDDVSANQQMIGKWKAKDSVSLNHMISNSFPMNNLDYPIKKVTLEFQVFGLDPINNARINEIVASYDVTDKWKKTQEKVKSNTADASQLDLNKNSEQTLKNLGF